MKGNLSYIRLLTTSFEKSYNFYKHHLGLKVKFGDVDSNYAEFDTGNATLALFSRKDMAEALGFEMTGAIQECQDKTVVIFQVDSVDDEYQRLQEKGIFFLAKPTDRPDWMIRTAHFRDPDGTIIEINQPLN